MEGTSAICHYLLKAHCIFLVFEGVDGDGTNRFLGSLYFFAI